jgi:hypothetical protein
MRILLILFGIITYACQNPNYKMEIRILKQKKIKVPAVSGLEVYGDRLLMISDNTEGLSVCDLSGNLLETIALENEFSPTQIIEKKHKSDYEACTFLSIENNDYLLLVGSGSKKENRNKAKLISLTNILELSNYDLNQFYSYLRTKSDIELNDFNIEALAYYDNKLYFFNRGSNEIFVVKKSAFFDFLKVEKTEIEFKKFKMEIEPIEGLYAVVSGATITAEGIVFITASAERTGDWYNDGEIVGSSIGWFDLSEMQSNFKVKTQLLKNGDVVLRSKIESVAVHSIDQNKAKLFLVSDNDGKESELFYLDLLLN